MQAPIPAVFGLDSNPEGHLALVCELDGVGHEVDYDLTQSAGISPHGLRHFGSHLAQEFQTLFVRPHREGLERGLQAVAQIEFDRLEIDSARLNLGKVENVIDYGEQRIR